VGEKGGWVFEKGGWVGEKGGGVTRIINEFL
jgi:hypothetical protein